MSQIDQDTLRLACTFLEVQDLMNLSRVSTEWAAAANSCEQWKLHCENLWHNKVNHPFVPWVRVDHDPIEDETEKDHIRAQITFLCTLLLEGDSRNLFQDTPRSMAIDESVKLLKTLEARHLCLLPQKAAPITSAIRYEQIELENVLYAMDPTADPASYETLKDVIVTNMATPVVVDDKALQSFRSEGRLLTWRQSYLASIADSFRCRLGYREYRLQGEILTLLYNTTLYKGRIVMGGHYYIGNLLALGGDTRPVKTTLSGNTTATQVTPDHVSNAYVLRGAHDWSWYIKNRDDATLVTYLNDRKKGFRTAKGRITLSNFIGRKRASVDEIKMTLFRNNPLYGLYTFE